MSSEIALTVEGVGKRFHIGGTEARYRTFRSAVTDAVTSPFRKAAHLLKGNPAAAANMTEQLWALRDVSFELEQGGLLGIIGHNGAGKSTLLKILSRITEPTEGRVAIRGRVGSLLEVGTGFHAELTGRENIYLNGAILGMGREELNRKLDAIVSFAGVERFLDTPVKFYSTGMELRLGFAVAAHLDPEVLLVDEVLAVGDAEFQQRCLSKMDGIAQSGRTVVLVSHNMGAISKLCRRVLWLDHGGLRMYDETEKVIRSYLSSATGSEVKDLESRPRSGKGPLRLRDIETFDADGRAASSIASGSSLRLRLHFESEREERLSGETLFTVRCYDQLKNLVFSLGNHLTGQSFRGMPSAGQIEVVLPNLLLVPGRYNLSVLIHALGQLSDHLEEVTELTVTDSSFLGGTIPMRPHVYGTFTMPHQWDQPSERERFGSPDVSAEMHSVGTGST